MAYIPGVLVWDLSTAIVWHAVYGSAQKITARTAHSVHAFASVYISRQGSSIFEQKPDKVERYLGLEIWFSGLDEMEADMTRLGGMGSEYTIYDFRFFNLWFLYIVSRACIYIYIYTACIF